MVKTLPEQPTTAMTNRGVGGQVMDALWPLLGGNHMYAETWEAISNAVMPIIKSLETERDKLKVREAELLEADNRYLQRARDAEAERNRLTSLRDLGL